MYYLIAFMLSVFLFTKHRSTWNQKHSNSKIDGVACASMTSALTFSYSVSETVERHDIVGMRPPPLTAWDICASLVIDNTPVEPCTVAYSHLNDTFMTQNIQKTQLMRHSLLLSQSNQF